MLIKPAENGRLQAAIAQTRHICGLFRFGNLKNRIKCGPNAIFPQQLDIRWLSSQQNPRSTRGGIMASGMTKTQLVRHLAEKLESNNKTAAAFLEHLTDVAVKETKKNGVFVVPGLGRLVKAHRKARMGRNPQTGEPIQIKAKTVVKFRVAKATKDAIAPPAKK